MNNNKNIIFNHTLEQYNKKYRNRTYKLIKYTKKQVEDFDKQYGHYTYNGKTHSLEFNNYLLKDRKWWFTKEDECYHEIPRPIRFVWFRNLNTGVQLATCALLAGGVIGGTTVGVVEYFKAKENGIVEIDKGNCPDGVIVSKGEKYFTETGDIGYKLNVEIDESKYKPEKDEEIEIKKIIVKKGKVTLEDITDYSYNTSTKELTIKKNSMDKYDGKLSIIPVVSVTKHKIAQADWIEMYSGKNQKALNKYSKAFQESGYKYNINNFKVRGRYKDVDGKWQEISYDIFPVEYGLTAGPKYEKIRFTKLNYLTDSGAYAQQTIAGDVYSHETIVDLVFKNLESAGNTIDYIIGDNYVKYNAYDSNNNLMYSHTFNEQGYIINAFTIKKVGNSSIESQIIVDYNDEPKQVDDSVDFTSTGYEFNSEKVTHYIKDKQSFMMFKTTKKNSFKFVSRLINKSKILSIDTLDFGILAQINPARKLPLTELFPKEGIEVLVDNKTLTIDEDYVVSDTDNTITIINSNLIPKTENVKVIFNLTMNPVYVNDYAAVQNCCGTGRVITK